MDVVERLTLEAAQADTMLACEHRHRYEFAADLLAGKRVLDLCCGSGYGSAILARAAQEVVGVDRDLATVESALVTVDSHPGITFEAAEAVEYLSREVLGRFDAVVCFEGLEHLQDLPQALTLLRERAERGLQIVASVPNDKLFREPNPFHVTTFGYDEALAAFANFPAVTMIPQFLAEGSLISPVGAADVDARVSLEDRHEPEYANHFIFCVNVEPELVQRAHHGRIQLTASPVFNRWSEDLKRGAWALRRENARLARARLGKGGSAAASAVARVSAEQVRTANLTDRWQRAEQRVAELEGELLALREEIAAGDGHDIPAEAGTASGDADGVEESAGFADVIPAYPYALGPGEDPNSWDNRRRRAAEVLIPWIEQTVPLEGKTVLEYGCGNAAVSCAFAQRAKRVIGLDIDRDWIEMGERELAQRGIRNVQLELHGVDAIEDAAAAWKNKVDVFLLYAVLEHLTVAERLQVLRLAREVVPPDGAIVVCETPNRLTYFDHHTAQMPFFHLLPDELATQVWERSNRDDFKDAMVGAAERGGPEGLHEAIVRWGRGVSYHEFELVFGDLAKHVIASSYDPILFPERPIHPEEVGLARYLDRTRPDLAPAFSRQWLDLILSPEPVEHRPPFLWPWAAETGESRRVGWTRWDNLRLIDGGASLWITLPVPTQRLVAGVVTQDGAPMVVKANPEAGPPAWTREMQPAAHHAVYASFRFDAPVRRLALSVSVPCHVVWVGYEA